MGKFVKGQSGNPGGRPKGVAEVEALARECTVEAIAALRRALLDKSRSTAAAIALLERAWGKPTQTLNTNVTVLDQLDAIELRSLAGAIEAIARDKGEVIDGIEEKAGIQ